MVAPLNDFTLKSVGHRFVETDFGVHMSKIDGQADIDFNWPQLREK